MSLYEFLVVVHVVAAAAWLGGGLVFTAIAMHAWASRDAQQVITLSRMGDHAGTRVFAPATLLLLASGIWAVVEGDWDVGDTWVSIGFSGWIIGLGIALGWHNSEGRRIRAAIEDGGVDGPRARRVARTGMILAQVELAVLVVVVWAMVAKPGA